MRTGYKIMRCLIFCLVSLLKCSENEQAQGSKVEQSLELQDNNQILSENAEHVVEENTKGMQMSEPQHEEIENHSKFSKIAPNLDVVDNISEQIRLFVEQLSPKSWDDPISEIAIVSKDSHLSGLGPSRNKHIYACTPGHPKLILKKLTSLEGLVVEKLVITEEFVVQKQTNPNNDSESKEKYKSDTVATVFYEPFEFKGRKYEVEVEIKSEANICDELLA